MNDVTASPAKKWYPTYKYNINIHVVRSVLIMNHVSYNENPERFFAKRQISSSKRIYILGQTHKGGSV